ncbi:hypothetical protein ABZ419_02940 [Streptomyces cinnamoneus]|uniref:hypothetical protein n=1 Tax=Streptomyces cinnamoneus TaxID=53446 RepID=UPI0033D4C05D
MDTRDAAWQIHFSLHQLAEAHLHDGHVHDELADAREQYRIHAPGVPDALAVRIRSVLDEWPTNPAGRLVLLLPVLDDLAELHGGQLPEFRLPKP